MDNNYFTTVNPYFAQQDQGLSPVFQNIAQQQQNQNMAIQQGQQMAQQAAQSGQQSGGMNPMMMAAMLRKKPGQADINAKDAQMGYNAQMGDFNQKQAAQQNFNQGLMGLGGAGIMAFSDIRMKENIKQINWLPNGLPVYQFEYKSEFKDIAGHGQFVGVMAQDVEMVRPEAVLTNSNGYKMVNYGVLNG